MNNSEEVRLLGEVCAEVRGLHERLDRMERDVRVTSEAMAELRGSRKLAWGIISAIGVVGGVVGAFVHYLLTVPR